MSKTANQRRWKVIREIAAKGPVYALDSWSRKKARLKSAIDSGKCPDALRAYFEQHVIDAAVAVRYSKPTRPGSFHPDSEKIRGANLLLRSTSGTEYTPAEFTQVLGEAIARLRVAFEDRDPKIPAPIDDEAFLELIEYVRKGKCV